MCQKQELPLGGLMGFLWQYSEPGIRGKEIEVKTLERVRHRSRNSGDEGDEGFVRRCCFA